MDLKYGIAVYWFGLLLVYSVPINSQNDNIFHFDAANTSTLISQDLRSLNFHKVKKKYLNVAAIVVLRVQTEKVCSFRCATELKCVSFNFANSPRPNEGHTCQLLAKDMFRHYRYLHSNSHFHHFTLQSKCLSWPCKNNGVCIPDYTTNTYRCKCRSGFKGKHCENDIDECATSRNRCHRNANCFNTAGSYTCTCKLWFRGNGTVCTLGGLENSAILSRYGNISYVHTLNYFLAALLQKPRKSVWVKCWHAAVDGWDVRRTFHPYCDNKGATVTIVRVNNCVFGGYSDVSWESPETKYHQTTDKAFIFSLFNIHGYRPMKLNVTNPNKAIWLSSSHGPYFYSDLFIRSNASTTKSHTMPYVYQTPPGCTVGLYCDFFAANTEDKFLISDIEVFYEHL